MFKFSKKMSIVAMSILFATNSLAIEQEIVSQKDYFNKFYDVFVSKENGKLFIKCNDCGIEKNHPSLEKLFKNYDKKSSIKYSRNGITIKFNKDMFIKNMKHLYLVDKEYIKVNIKNKVEIDGMYFDPKILERKLNEYNNKVSKEKKVNKKTLLKVDTKTFDKKKKEKKLKEVFDSIELSESSKPKVIKVEEILKDSKEIKIPKIKVKPIIESLEEKTLIKKEVVKKDIKPKNISIDLKIEEPMKKIVVKDEILSLNEKEYILAAGTFFNKSQAKRHIEKHLSNEKTSLKEMGKYIVVRLHIISSSRKDVLTYSRKLVKDAYILKINKINKQKNIFKKEIIEKKPIKIEKSVNFINVESKYYKIVTGSFFKEKDAIKFNNLKFPNNENVGYKPLGKYVVSTIDVKANVSSKDALMEVRKTIKDAWFLKSIKKVEKVTK